MPNTVIAVTDAAKHYSITIGRTYCDYKGIIHYKSFLINYNKRLWGQAITISRNHVQMHSTAITRTRVLHLWWTDGVTK